MFDSPIVGVAIGLFLLFAILATIASAIAESISRLIGLRGAYLLRGLRTLVDGEAKGTSAELKALFEDSGILRAQGTLDENDPGHLDLDKKKLKWGKKRKLPSYIAGRSFVAAILRRVTAGDASVAPNMQAIAAGIDRLDDGPLKDQLSELVKTAEGNVETFKASVGSWYDDHMDRVSGWYKRKIKNITLVIGIVLVIGLNIPIIAFAQALYTDQALRESTVTQAIEASECGENTDSGECLRSAREELEKLQPGLRLGWGQVPDCVGADPACGFLENHGFLSPTGGTGADVRLALTVLLGWVLLIGALLPGSRFWFDLINRFNSMRLTGPKPYPVATPEQG